MDTPLIYSFGLSQLFGLFLLIIGVVFLSRQQYYRDVFANTKPNNPIIMLTAIFGLFLGIVFTGTHNIIVFERRSIVTILSWLVLINSICWLMLPEKMLRLTQKIMTGSGYTIVSLIISLSGFWLLIRGSEIFIMKNA
ncbi:MAG: hypothetical protein P1U74_04390 [Legionellaceae bacterium]|nr:hypothetical protein [Legionellaceae bacterium]